MNATVRMRAALAGVLAATGLLMPAAAATPTMGAPDPYGEQSADITVTVTPDGTLAVQERLSFQLHSSGVDAQGGSISYDLGGTVHMGFRLPSTDDFPVAPYLRPAWSDLTVAARDQDGRVKGTVERNGHALVYDAVGSYGAGEHSARIGYRISGAAQTVDGGDGKVTELRFRPLTGLPVESVTIEGPGLRAAQCVTIPPESTPCATASGGSLEIRPGDGDGWGQAGNRSAELVIEADPSAYTLKAPVIDAH